MQGVETVPIIFILACLVVVVAAWLLLRSLLRKRRRQTKTMPSGSTTAHRAQRKPDKQGAKEACSGPEERRARPNFQRRSPRSARLGQTLLLTSMYHEMHTRSNRSYYLKAPFDQVTLLNQWYAEVADTAGLAIGDRGGRLAHVRLHRANSNGVREGRARPTLTTSNTPVVR